MLSSQLSTGLSIFLGLVVVFCIFCAVFMHKMTSYCRDAVEFVQLQNKNSVSLRQIADLTATVTELKDAYDALLTSHKKLRSRIGMRKVREKRANGADEGVQSTDKTEVRKAAKAAGLLRG